MTVEEVRQIKEQISLKTAGMSVNEMRAYYSVGASEAQKKIDDIRKHRGETNRNPVSVASV